MTGAKKNKPNPLAGSLYRNYNKFNIKMKSIIERG